MAGRGRRRWCRGHLCLHCSTNTRQRKRQRKAVTGDLYLFIHLKLFSSTADRKPSDWETWCCNVSRTPKTFLVSSGRRWLSTLTWQQWSCQFCLWDCTNRHFMIWKCLPNFNQSATLKLIFLASCVGPMWTILNICFNDTYCVNGSPKRKAKTRHALGSWLKPCCHLFCARAFTERAENEGYMIVCSWQSRRSLDYTLLCEASLYLATYLILVMCKKQVCMIWELHFIVRI